jgi:hypothetical protein
MTGNFAKTWPSTPITASDHHADPIAYRRIPYATGFPNADQGIVSKQQGISTCGSLVLMPPLGDSQTRSLPTARRSIAPIGSNFGRRMAECIAPRLKLEHEIHHAASKQCILCFEPLE